MKVVLAYSGGLDTTVAVRLLQESYGAEIITVLVDVGQPKEKIAFAEKRAYMLGVSEHYTIDAKEEFVQDYVFPAIKANLQHDDCYLTPCFVKTSYSIEDFRNSKRRCR